ncbi:gamma-glutamylcyclotransferase family protein [Kangiella shandongensis]|uniref:gamma-glutamylcyclotransferase family protein n=1 Tax=Kangiella shandongensis TaxID=2763258 RepID=UPI001CBFFF51|nr:gamma-glutamylcyclotransferase family protein [Kangiella shandongensis]
MGDHCKQTKQGHKLFSYGTLQQEKVQLETFGRKLEGSKDVLVGYKVGQTTITDKAVIAASGKRIHPILKYTGSLEDKVEGMVFEISAEELEQADAYEVKDYCRTTGELQSGREAWIYTEA